MKRIGRIGVGRDSDSGFTLVELLIAILLVGMISAFVAASVVSSHKIVRTNDDQTRGLEQVRVAAERLDRDVRDSRAVLCNPNVGQPGGTPSSLAAADPNCQYHLQLWIDYNSDYVQQAGETVTWELCAGTGFSNCGQPTAGAHYTLVRSVGSSNQAEAAAIVQQVAFSYSPCPPSPAACHPSSTVPAPGAFQFQLVNVGMTYDALYTSGKKSNRTVSFSARLRNVS